MAIDAAAIRRGESSERDEKFYKIDLLRDELDRSIGGGLPKNSLMLFEGGDGAGKSILAQRLTYGFLEHGASVTYISTELNTMGFVEQMESMDYDVKNYLINKNLLFIPMFPLLGTTKLADNFFKKLLVTKQIFENEIIIFDTLSFLLIKNSITDNEVFDMILTLKRLTTLGKTILFCVDPDHLTPTFLTMIRSICDIYFKIDLRAFAGSLVRVIAVQRFKRPMAEVSNSIPFKIEPGKGLAIEIASLD